MMPSIDIGFNWAFASENYSRRMVSRACGGLHNHPGGYLGPLEVIFELFKKIDFLKFFRFSQIFWPLELVRTNSVFRPADPNFCITHARPNIFGILGIPCVLAKLSCLSARLFATAWP